MTQISGSSGSEEAGAHVLVVDDEAPIRELLAEILKVSGYRVTAVASAGAALAQAKQARPDLLLTDLQLEDSDGIELSRQVKELHPDLPVILLTGVLYKRDVVRPAMGETISTYLEKTVPLERIIEEVRRLLAA